MFSYIIKKFKKLKLGDFDKLKEDPVYIKSDALKFWISPEQKKNF